MHGSHGAARSLSICHSSDPPPPLPLPLSRVFDPRPLVPSCRYPSRIRRIHRSLVSRVTLYLFRAPSDRPSAVCTESTWSFRWDLTARGRGRGSTGTYMSDTYMSRDREKERDLSASPSSLFAVDLHRSILHFRRFRLRRELPPRVTSSRFPSASSGSQQADYVPGHSHRLFPSFLSA